MGSGLGDLGGGDGVGERGRERGGGERIEGEGREERERREGRWNEVHVYKHDNVHAFTVCVKKLFHDRNRMATVHLISKLSFLPFLTAKLNKNGNIF